MPICMKCGKKENAMKCICEDCTEKAFMEIDKLVRQVEMEKGCVTKLEDKHYLDGQIQILLILRNKL